MWHTERSGGDKGGGGEVGAQREGGRPEKQKKTTGGEDVMETSQTVPAENLYLKAKEEELDSYT